VTNITYRLHNGSPINLFSPLFFRLSVFTRKTRGESVVFLLTTGALAVELGRLRAGNPLSQRKGNDTLSTHPLRCDEYQRNSRAF
jgi:hypothetical protein